MTDALELTEIPKTCLTCAGTLWVLVEGTRFAGARRGTCRCASAHVSFEVRMSVDVQTDRPRSWWGRWVELMLECYR